MARDEGMPEGRGFGYKFLYTQCFKTVHIENKMLSGLMAQACNPTAGEVEAKRLRVQGYPEQLSMTMSQNKSKMGQGAKYGGTHPSSQHLGGTGRRFRSSRSFCTT